MPFLNINSHVISCADIILQEHFYLHIYSPFDFIEPFTDSYVPQLQHIQLLMNVPQSETMFCPMITYLLEITKQPSKIADVNCKRYVQLGTSNF